MMLFNKEKCNNASQLEKQKNEEKKYTQCQISPSSSKSWLVLWVKTDLQTEKKCTQ